MGEATPGYYAVSSAPTIVQGKVILGGWVMDNQFWGEPSGVIRAYDAVTGKLAWAWDMGRPDRQGEPSEGETFTRSTPNAWAPMSVDEQLGLVYVPTGNATPDYFGADRRPFDDHYSSSVVALDVTNGRPRWSFQTAHHDLWDYDVAAQPTLVDYSTPTGVVKALLQATKRGELFLLDRATGDPLSRVEERPAPSRGAVPEERVAATQPFSVGLPSFRGADLVEGDMWGITPLDQLWCRIKFREARYDGPNTPPGLTPSIEMPGWVGGMEWGGVAVDTERHIVIVNSQNLPNYLRLIPRSQADGMDLKPYDGLHGALAAMMSPAQAGTKYGVLLSSFLSPLEIPCNRPPYGRLSAIDLPSGKLMWTQVFGTARNSGPLGVPSMLPLQLGTPNIGGAVATAGGLFFIAATQDEYLRAYETTTGKLLWQARLPTGGHATPMTYLSPASGRQLVVIAAGGHLGLSPTTGAYIAAFALPKADAR
jgi:quinoprotein glucose dehydrogenase